ncbi:heparinase II/III domain-containing protein [Puia dinghuensis]|uniref:heparinase II/III domain-containing protein n=1 Tax=Puia dinghuensis TaxID=1792502 RepID=UPI0016672C76|nr:heparinase II/III family protein [Puia dinghuensis]
MLISILAFLLLGPSANAQLTPRNLLEKEMDLAGLQRVLVSQAAWKPFPQSAVGWAKILPDSIRAILIKNGEACLQGPFPNVPATVTLDFFRNGNRTRYENLVFGKRNRLWALVLAESVEGRGRFLDAILDGIWSISEETFWGASAHLFLQKGGKGLPDADNPVVDLFAAETAANLAWADYFIGPELDSISPLVRGRIYYEVNRRIFVPMETAKYDWLGAGNREAKLNNWAPWIMSNYLTAVLLLEKEGNKRTQYVYRAMQVTDQYLNGLGDDGACEEGPTYWAYGPGCVLDVLDLLQSATNGRINIFHADIVRNMAAYIYRVHIGGNYFVNIGDAHPEMAPEPCMIRRFGAETGDTVMRGFGNWLYAGNGYAISQQFHRTRELFDFMDIHDIRATPAVFTDIGDAWLPDVQLMVSRLAHGLFVAAHAGNNGKSHNHNDVGDFIVYVDGQPVIVDVGSGTYTARTFSKDRYRLWFNTSAFHNLPTVNGQQQQEGLAYGASQVSYRADRRGARLTMNLAKAYPASAGVSAWNRSILAEKAGKITITDNCQADSVFSSLTQNIMTVGAVDITVPGLIVFATDRGKKVQLHYDARVWSVQSEEMQLTTPEEEGLKESWHHRTITRIRLDLKSPVRVAVFQYTIVAK